MSVGCINAWPYFPHTKVPWSGSTISSKLREPKSHLLLPLFLSARPPGWSGWCQFNHIQANRVSRQGYSDSPMLAMGFQLPRCVAIITQHHLPHPRTSGQNCSPPPTDCWFSYQQARVREGVGKRSEYGIISFSLKST